MAIQKRGALTYADLLKQVKQGRVAPVTLLHGEEGYYIDRLVEAFEELVPESERDFNLYTLYAPQTTMATVHEVCSRYPMMAERQVVILKECQSARANELDKLAAYLRNPSPTTALVVCFRGETAKGKDLLAALKDSGAVMFESRKLTDSAVASVISGLIAGHGLNIEPKGLSMLRDHVGTDVSRLYNEIEKLVVALPKGAMVTPEVIERHVGISKDYNNFELVEALATRNIEKVFTIVNYFRANPKNCPWPLTLSMIYNYFSDVMIATFAKDKSPGALMAEMDTKASRRVDKAIQGTRYYNAWQLIEIMGAIRQCDVQSKGVGSRRDPYDLLFEMVYHILYAQGR